MKYATSVIFWLSDFRSRRPLSNGHAVTPIPRKKLPKEFRVSCLDTKVSNYCDSARSPRKNHRQHPGKFWTVEARRVAIGSERLRMEAAPGSHAASCINLHPTGHHSVLAGGSRAKIQALCSVHHLPKIALSGFENDATRSG